MRRGHPGAGGWRGENPRHFRPRAGGTPHYRHPRGYGQQDSPRFPPRLLGLSVSAPYNRHANSGDHLPDRNNHRQGGHRGNQRLDRGSHYGQRQILPYFQRIRQSDNDGPFFENNQSPQTHTNSMGDVDHRQPMHPRPINLQGPLASWPVPPSNYDDRRNINKPFRSYSGEANKTSMPDYAGHRPPSSDHYGGNPGSVLDNSNSFSRSVDDTVDIVRKRLLNRDSHPSGNIPGEQNDDQAESSANEMAFSISQQEQPKKRVQKTRHNVKSDCDKIKNKIVHQLFVMDKEKIHKLMDNPSSSSKFEFAISSLVTESQNSYNRHMRSLAEKSLCSSSTEFVLNDTNTIYEDTFMRQMQCLLDPQDTVLLEDLKPVVLAELSKVLQLNELDQYPDDQNYPHEDQLNINQFPSDSHIYGDCPELESNDHSDYYNQTSYERAESKYFEDMQKEFGSQAKELQDAKPIFERRQPRNRVDKSAEFDKRSERKSVDSRFAEENPNRSVTPLLTGFDPNVDNISDEDDPFAEFDRQYHVAVDPSFITTDEPSFSRSPSPNLRPQTPTIKREPGLSQTPQNCQSSLSQRFEIRLQDFSKKIKSEIDSDLHSFSRSQIKFPSIFDRPLEESPNMITEENIKQELIQEVTTKAVNDKFDYTDSKNQNSQRKNSRPVEEKPDVSQKSSKDSNSRKRSTEQRPSHRKEKRKKCETFQPESNKQILNKNIIINVNDCAAKSSEKCEAPKSIFNLFFSKDKNCEENKKNESTDKNYSDKYVKRKEKDLPKKSIGREKESDKKRRDSSASHSILSPTDACSSSSLTPTKTDSTAKLKTIDIFGAVPKKTNIHQAHRNTAAPPITPNKPSSVEVKCKPPPLTGRKVTKRHIATQVTRKSNAKETQTMESKCSSSRFTQTEKQRLISRGAQTVPVGISLDKSKPSDPLERMKEIDLEIQMLLQEKFKLYSSIEAKEQCSSSTMQSLGMAVLNMTPAPYESKESQEDLDEDMIVEDFANIPVEELEQLAFESVEQASETPVVGKKSKRLKAKVIRKHSVSPATSITSTRSKRNSKSLNISLIEQIITDERPLEDIISLDDLELPPVKSKKKKARTPKKKTKKSKNNKAVSEIDYSGIVKPCSVVLLREEMDTYLSPKEEVAQFEECVEQVVCCVDTDVVSESVVEDSNVVEETVASDIHFDMLDVSEDIIIGDMCEVKSGDASNSADMSMSVCEEVILDNSQSSEDVVPTETVINENKCKTFDFSADENLRRDSMVVSGNGDAILAIECIDKNFIAASLDGNVYHFSGDGRLLNTLKGSNLAVTCLTIVKEKCETTVYTGSLDSRIRYYDLDTGLEKGPECNVLSPIQTMDRAWDTIFVGTRTGFVLQFECKNNMLIPVSTVKFSEQSILALKALKEGPRKVLLVGARSESVTIKDAQTGLLLRTLEGPKMSVYSLLFEDGKVYCGTSSSQIHVFDYTSGSHLGTHEGGKGTVCLRSVGGLVFAGCYDGCVYVYAEDSRPIAQLRGPSLMLLSLAVLGTKIIAGYKDRSVYIWKIPLSILQEMIL